MALALVTLGLEAAGSLEILVISYWFFLSWLLCVSSLLHYVRDLGRKINCNHSVFRVTRSTEGRVRKKEEEVPSSSGWHESSHRADEEATGRKTRKQIGTSFTVDCNKVCHFQENIIIVGIAPSCFGQNRDRYVFVFAPRTE